MCFVSYKKYPNPIKVVVLNQLKMFIFSLSELVANASTLLDNHPSLKNVFVHGSEHAFSLGSIPSVMGRLSSKYPRVGFYRPSKALDGEADAEFEKHTGKQR